MNTADIQKLKHAMEVTLAQLRWATRCIELSSLPDRESGVYKKVFDAEHSAGLYGQLPPSKAFKCHWGVSLEQMDEWIEQSSCKDVNKEDYEKLYNFVRDISKVGVGGLWEGYSNQEKLYFIVGLARDLIENEVAPIQIDEEKQDEQS